MKKRLHNNIIFYCILGLFVLFIGVYLYYSRIIIDGKIYFGLYDDGLISMRYAYNLIHGYGPIWNPGGAHVEGFTNPGWVFFMALVQLLPLPISIISIVISLSDSLFLLINLIYVRKLTKFVSNNNLTALLAVFFTAFYYPLIFWSINGAEVGILATLTTILAYYTIISVNRKNINLLPYVIIGLAIVIRMDMIIISAIAVFYLISHQLKKSVHLLIVFILFQIVVVLPIILQIWYYGYPLPNTYYLKMTGYPIFLRIARGFLVYLNFIKNINWLIYFIAISALIIKKNKYILFLLSIFLGQSLYSIFVGGDIGEQFPSANRFLSIVMPIFMILFAIGITEIVVFISKVKYIQKINTSSRYILRISKYGAIALLVLYSTLEMSHTPVQNWFPNNTNQLMNANSLPYHIASGLYFKCISNPRATIAVVWAGATPYFANRTAIDLLGKSDAVVAHEPMLTPAPNDPNRFIFFGPGHLKWDYPYSIGVLHPDIIEQLFGNISSAMPYLNDQYTLINGFYIRNNDKNVYINKMGSCLKYFEA